MLRVTQKYWGRVAVSPKVSTLIIPIGAATFGGPIRGQGLLHQSEPWHFWANPSPGTFMAVGGRSANPSSGTFTAVGGRGANPSSGTFTVVGGRGANPSSGTFLGGGSLDHQLAKSVHPGTVGATPLLRQMVSPVERL